MHAKLLEYICSDHDCTPGEREAVIRYFEPVVFSKNTLIEGAGKVPQYLYYIVSGYLRLFFQGYSRILISPKPGMNWGFNLKTLCRR